MANGINVRNSSKEGRNEVQPKQLANVIFVTVPLVPSTPGSAPVMPPNAKCPWAEGSYSFSQRSNVSASRYHSASSGASVGPMVRSAGGFRVL